jgi:hypothetical protein
LHEQAGANGGRLTYPTSTETKEIAFQPKKLGRNIHFGLDSERFSGQYFSAPLKRKVSRGC